MFLVLCISIMLNYLNIASKFCAVRSNVYAEEKVVPALKIAEAKEWKRIDTKFCRFYFCQDEEDYVSAKAGVFNAIYEEICAKFKHFAKGSPNEDGLVTFFLLDDSTYKSVTGDSIAGACFNKGFGFINISRKNITNLDGTCRHELIHLVTLSSLDSKLTNYPHWFSEGIAQYYQPNLKTGSYNVSLLKKAIKNNQLSPWYIIGRNGWGNENRSLKYNQAACMYEYLIQKYGEEKIIEIFYTEGDFFEIIKKVSGKTINQLENEWQKEITLKLG